MAQSPALTIRLIRAFEGPLHDRLYAIWDAAAEFLAPHVNVRWFANPGAKLSHAECFQRIWAEEREFDNEFVCLTEADFLPNLGKKDWLGLRHAKRYPAWGVQYATRGDKASGMRMWPHLAGGWFVVINKARAPEKLVFFGRPDPCNQLPQQIKMYLEPGKDAWPTHPGIDYSYGGHLFWARHYNDPPETVVSGMKMGVVQHLVDAHIDRWLKQQPKRFREIHEHRFLSAPESPPPGHPAPSAP